ncbi:inositol monophosphatase family protein [Ferrovum sp.]|uniref:inositol monophosphatase family protein n=1 Tax=Ferrovum sp. TaxID=2609467 RepID=UPI00262E0EEF|nr:inositol monophosphatase family protein [Ferrovum sp.]
MRSALIQVIQQVAQEQILPRYQKVRHDRKADGSLFTEADLATQEALAGILPTLVDCPLLGEEMSSAAQQKLWQEHDTLWCVDPIDGTSNFVQGIPYFAVSVALLRRGKPVLGAVYDPLAREMFVAEAGQGAWMNDLPLSAPRTPATLAQTMAAVDLKRLPPRLSRALACHPPYASQRNFGACTLEWCHVAAGRFGVSLHGGQKLWDYAAGALILEEAGGVYASLEGTPFWSGDPWTRSVVAACHPALFTQWQDWLHRFFTAPETPRTT